MTQQLYIIPVIHLTNPDYNVPAYLPHRFHAAIPGLEGIPWAWTTYLLEDVAIVLADTTVAQNTLLDAQAGVFPIANLDATISGTTIRNRVRSALENAFVPGTWITTGMSYRNILRAVAGMFEFHNRVVAISQGRVFDGVKNLSTTINQLSATQISALTQTATEFGINYSGITGSSTLRAALLLANNLYNASRPFVISGAGLSMVI
jgi:hypothetical protein